MKKIIIFDLYDTVWKEKYFKIEDGLSYLYDKFFSDKCSAEEFVACTETFLPLYEKREIDDSEVCLIKDEIPFIFDRFGVPMPESAEALEFDIMQKMLRVELTDDAIHTLGKLSEMGIQMYILSNSIFTSNATRKLLEKYGIFHYFKKVFTSADHGVGKPSHRFYKIALSHVLTENEGLCADDILYVGNDYKTDATGASSFGLRTVWYNEKHLPNTNRIDVIEIDDFRKIVDIVQNT